MGPTTPRPARRLLALALLAGVAAGCTGPNGTLTLPSTHAFLSETDGHTVRIEVRPQEITSPTGTQRVLIATVYDETGQPRRGRRVEWLLEGVGSILEVDEGGYGAVRGYKTDNRYAVTFTDYFEHRITRGNDDPHDDFMARPGQAWCVVTSAVEGETRVTAYAPGIADWASRKVVVTARWTDTDCDPPPPASQRAGGEAALTTRVRRHSDGRPLPNYQVRYRLLDGPPVRLGPPSLTPPGIEGQRTEDSGRAAVAVSDSGGVATMKLAQAEARAGVSRFAVEVVRPPDPDGPNTVETVVYRGETALEWQAPQVGLAVTGPTSAVVGQEVPYTLTVSSTGSLDVPPLTVQQTVPEGWQLVRSDPPAAPDGDRVIWTLPGLAAGKKQELRAVLRPTRPGPAGVDARASTSDGLAAEARAETRVAEAQLRLSLTGPTGAVSVGDVLSYQIVVANPGSGPAGAVTLRAGFDPGLAHDSKMNPLEASVSAMKPGQTETVPLNLTALKPGRQVLRVAVTGEAGLADKAEYAVEVKARQLDLALTGPERQYAGREASWDLTVRNGGDVALANVVVRDRLPAGVAFRSATAEGRPADGDVVWYVGALPPGESRLLKVTGLCQQAGRSADVATASAAGLPERRTEAMLDVLGVPALHVDLTSTGSPAQVGGAVVYRLTAVNDGTLPAVGVELSAELSKQLKVVRSGGPTTAKVEGQRLTFPPVDSVPPGKSVEYTVEAQAVEPGDGRFTAELRSATLSAPVRAEEATRVLPPVGPAR